MITARIIPNRYIEGLVSRLQYPAYEFVVIIKAIRLDGYGSQTVFCEGFIAPFIFADARSIQNVGCQRDHMVSYPSKPVQRFPLPAVSIRLNSHAYNNFGPAFKNRRNHRLVIARVVFQIGVLKNDDVTTRGCDTGLEGSAFAAIDL